MFAPISSIHSIIQESIIKSPWSYQSLIGTLWYLVNNMRGKITYAVTVFARYTSDPKAHHYQDVKKIDKCLQGTILQLKVFCDSNFARSFSDAIKFLVGTVKSRTGFVIDCWTSGC